MIHGKRKPPGALRASGKQRRLVIIEAALQVIAADGLRAVSHRSVAARADVPLAATTYYFRDLADLITESFLHWSARQREQVESFYRKVLELLAGAQEAVLAPELLAQQLAELASAYIFEQVGAGRDDRVLELAFLHEAARLPGLREAVQDQQQEFLDFLQQFHTALGSARPRIDAQISHSVLLGLEKQMLLSDAQGGEAVTAIRAVLLAYLESVLGASEVKMPKMPM